MSATGESPPRVYNIPAGVAFLPTFAASLLAGGIVPSFPVGGPLALAAATIYVPTQRAARALAVEFTRLLPGPSALLPRIVPLGNLESLENDLLLHEAGPNDVVAADIPEAASEIDRRMTLARLVLAWTRQVREAIVSIDANGEAESNPDEALLVTTAPGQAWHLAGELGGLIDEMVIEGIDWTALEKIVPDAFDHYWRITLEFLKIAVAQWPAHLAERDLVDGIERRARLIEAEVARLAGPRPGPVVAIGSTGTNRATAHLLAAIARNPQGAVVLPGLDRELDEAAWLLIAGEKFDGHDSGAGHPQAALRRLLRVLQITREDVVDLAVPSPPIAARMQFLHEALRPADSTDHWRDYVAKLDPAGLARAFDGVTLIEADNERDEALALAISLREVLERPGATAALVTPDRQLARRVRGELARWDIDVDDSGGEPLGTTAHGTLARLLLDCAGGVATPVETLSLLAHPLTLLSLPRVEIERLSPLLEIGMLRTILPDIVDPSTLIAAARSAAKRRDAHPAQARIDDNEWTALTALLERLHKARAPLESLAAGAPLQLWLAAHRATLAAVIRDAEGNAIGQGEDFETLQLLFEELAAADDLGIDFSVEDYRAFFEIVVREATVRGPQRSHPRLKILGLLEARLLTADVMLLAGLDEGVWPPQAATDAFLNRPMRAELGLTPPERRIGQTAHDFVMAMGNPLVVVSRAKKRDGTPTVPSRFLQRLAALAGEASWRMFQARGDRLLAFAQALDRPETVAAISRPMPRPSVALRPMRLSVTRIETLRRDPYAIYAERILRLEPLADLGSERGAREAGTALHEVLADFTRAHPNGVLPENAAAILARRAKDIFAAFLDNADFRAFQWPRIESGLAAFLGWERDRRKSIGAILVEAHGSLAIPLLDGSIFTLTGVADRIERHRDGSITIVDYKSGQLPSAKQVNVGFSPQLTLEAAMVEKSAFKEIPPPLSVASALYVKVGGGEGLQSRAVGDRREPLVDLVAKHFDGLVSLIEEFRNFSTPYLPRPFPQFASNYGDYDHLARVKEWSAGSSDEGGGT